MKNVNVNISSKNTQYKIDIGHDFIKDKIQEFIDKDCFFIIDKKVYELYYHIMPKTKVFIYCAKESNKTIKQLEKIFTFLQKHKCLRDSNIISIGGGITGDISSLAASLYMRGVKLIQVPTTLLAMIDSSTGGKTAVNFMGIKNNIGSFYQPESVLIDTDFLNTLSKKEYLNGLIEALKIACVQDKDFFDYLNNNKNKIINKDKNVLSDIIVSSCRLKAKIVEQDEQEAGIRKLLNFGHTIAHGIETDSNYKISHGYAVAIGMALESLYALKYNYIAQDTYDKIYKSIKSFGYKTNYKIKDINIFINALMQDKKAEKNGITLSLSGNDMKGIIVKNINIKEIIDLLQ